MPRRDKRPAKVPGGGSAAKHPLRNIHTMNEAYAYFKLKYPDLDQTAAEQEWYRLLAKFAPGKDQDLITPEEWQKIEEEVKK